MLNINDRHIAESDEVDQLVFPGRFADRVAVITGGAQGMGRAVAQRLSAEGAAVVIADIEIEKANALAEELPNSIAVRTDVCRMADCEAMVARATETFGGVDILFACAGGAILPPQSFWEMPEADWDFILDVNLKGQWLSSKAVVPEMQKRGGGKIVNVSSGGGLNGTAGLGAYCAAKAGLINLTKTMARELGQFGITVNSIAPGFIRVEHPKTVFTEDQFDKMGESAKQRQCVQRVGRTYDIANVGTFLASRDADFMSGEVLVVDGGTGR